MLKAMKILVLNSGSSSVKYKLIDTDGERVLAEGGVEKIGLSDGFLKFKRPDGTKDIVELGLTDHKGAIEAVLRQLTDPKEGCIKSYKEIDAVGHRVVHGGEKFAKSVVIDEAVKEMIRQCYDIAPLHNPANMTGIEAMEALLPGVPQVAVFDTTFHGTSHRYVSQRVCEILGVDIKDVKIITCHVGNGGSITAVDGGRSVDTSMGLTPTEGLMMGTRVGDVDPGAITYLMTKHGLSAADIQRIINKESGMAGLTGISSDMREIEAAVNAGNERAKLGLDMYEQRITKYIGAYAAEMGGVDIIVFTGGVGENQCGLRADVCKPLAFMGVEIDAEANKARGEEAVISTPASKVKVVVVPTDEELMIARDTAALVK